MQDRTGAICILDPPVASHADAHGATFDTILDGIRMRVLLPEAPPPDEERQSPGSVGDLRAPTGMDRRLRNFMLPQLPTSTPWGYVTRPSTGESWVRRIVIELERHVPRIHASRMLSAWEGRMLLWLEVWTRQNLSRAEPKGGPMAAMGIVHMRDNGVVAPGAMLAQTFVGPLHHIELAAFRADWEKATKLAAQGIDPPLEHRLLREAEIQLGRGEQRLSVITAGTAVEIAVAAHLRSHAVNVGHDSGLGHVLGIARDQRRLHPLGLDYDQDIHPTLVALRNSAVHLAHEPSTDETIAALDVSTTLMGHFAPLDPYRARP